MSTKIKASKNLQSKTLNDHLKVPMFLSLWLLIVVVIINVVPFGIFHPLTLFAVSSTTIPLFTGIEALKGSAGFFTKLSFCVGVAIVIWSGLMLPTEAALDELNSMCDKPTTVYEKWFEEKSCDN